MAKKTTTALVELDDASLLSEFAQLKDTLFKLRFRRATGELENHSLIAQTKKEIARVLTELRAREIRAAEQVGEQS